MSKIESKSLNTSYSNILLIVCKIGIDILLKLVKQVFEKTNLDKGIQSFGQSAIKIALWAITIIIVAGAFGVDTASLVTLLGVASLALSLSVQNIHAFCVVVSHWLSFAPTA